MSNEALTWAFAQQVGSPGAKFVLVALADKADEAHSCWPSQATLARMTDQGERTVRRHLAELEEAGFIARTQRRQAGHRSSDRYTLAVSVAVSVRAPIPKAQAAKSAGSQAAKSAGSEQTQAASVAGSQPANFDRTKRPDWPGNPQENPHVEPTEGATAVAVAEAPKAAGTENAINRRAQVLAKAFYDLRPMSSFPAVMGVCKKAINAGHTDESIAAALQRLAKEGRSVTVETLRIELEGQPPISRGRGKPEPLSAAEKFRREQQMARSF